MHALRGTTGGMDVADDVVEQAKRFLRSALDWSLDEETWNRLGTVITNMETATGSGDLSALRSATHELEDLGGRRVIRLGAPPRVPAAQPLRERIGELIHALTPDADEDDENDPNPDQVSGHA